MLVVIGIIAVLVGAALAGGDDGRQQPPAARRSASRSSQLNDAVESYKQDKGDYPPNFRDYDAFIRHVRKCYPKIAPTQLEQPDSMRLGRHAQHGDPPPSTRFH